MRLCSTTYKMEEQNNLASVREDMCSTGKLRRFHCIMVRAVVGVVLKVLRHLS
jgi:hypothetical protein